jgi:methylthioribose-1-phosphate isomerase
MNLQSMGLRFQNEHLEILDQQLLPQKEVWIIIRNVEQMIQAIRQLKVRGAPLIGVAAALALGDSARKGAGLAQLIQEAQALNEARPTAVNLMLAMARLRPLLSQGAEKIWTAAVDLFHEDVALCERIALCGLPAFQEGDSILTHCNSGGLATAGIGTALGVIRKVWESGRKIHVYVDETRPLLQGGRLTAWELGKLGIPYTLIADNMAGFLMKQGKIHKVVLGSDRIAANGDFANKIGTYSVAVLAKAHSIPFYVAAPWTTVDPHCPSGAQIPIEERRPEEVRGALGSFGQVQWSPDDAVVYNPAFDVTPAELVSGWIMDRGLLDQSAVRAGAFLKA